MNPRKERGCWRRLYPIPGLLESLPSQSQSGKVEDEQGIVFVWRVEPDSVSFRSIRYVPVASDGEQRTSLFPSSPYIENAKLRV